MVILKIMNHGGNAGDLKLRKEIVNRTSPGPARQKRVYNSSGWRGKGESATTLHGSKASVLQLCNAIREVYLLTLDNKLKNVEAMYRSTLSFYVHLDTVCGFR